jgi:hypothetical protein
MTDIYVALCDTRWLMESEFERIRPNFMGRVAQSV